jgi:hypothetical protein
MSVQSARCLGVEFEENNFGNKKPKKKREHLFLVSDSCKVFLKISHQGKTMRPDVTETLLSFTGRPSITRGMQNIICSMTPVEVLIEVHPNSDTFAGVNQKFLYQWSEEIENKMPER